MLGRFTGLLLALGVGGRKEMLGGLAELTLALGVGVRRELLGRLTGLLLGVLTGLLLGTFLSSLPLGMPRRKKNVWIFSKGIRFGLVETRR